MDKVDTDSNEITECQDVADPYAAAPDAKILKITTESDRANSAMGCDQVTAAVGSDHANSGLRCGAASKIPEATRDHIKAVIYGHCMGDAIGLLSEFYGKDQAVKVNTEQQR